MGIGGLPEAPQVGFRYRSTGRGPALSHGRLKAVGGPVGAVSATHPLPLTATTAARLFAFISLFFFSRFANVRCYLLYLSGRAVLSRQIPLNIDLLFGV